MTGSPTESSSPSPSASLPPGQALQQLATRGVAANWTATYSLAPVDPAVAPATVTVFRLGEQLRLDIDQGKTTTLFMTTPDGYVSCRVEGNDRTCLLVGPVGKPVPKVFDPGLQRIFTADLVGLASPAGKLAVEPHGQLAPVEKLPGATCFAVSGGQVDAGEYCLTDTGVPRRVIYPTGRLTMTQLDGAPNPQVFTPPVPPTPVPSGATAPASPKASASPKPS